MIRFIKNPDICEDMGKSSRLIAKKFDVNIINSKIFESNGNIKYFQLN